MRVNCHVHTNGSDGALDAEEVIKEAIKQNVDFICLTDHYRAPENICSFWKVCYSQDHFEKLVALKEKYKDKLGISVGAEFDWTEGCDDWYKKAFSERKYEYAIGSVHGFLNANKFCSFWHPENERKDFIKNIGGSKKYVEEYYRQVRLMAKSGFFDCVGHLDLIKINNKNNELFSEEDDWYKKEIDKTLDDIKKSGICIEINMLGVERQGEGKQYPSKWILEEAKKKNIPIAIGNDFHSLRYGSFDHLLDMAIDLAKDVGYTSVSIFKDRKPTEVEI